MDAEHLEKLRKSLTKDYVRRIRERLNKYSPSFIFKVMTGSLNNNEIIDCAIELAKEDKVIEDKRKQEIANL